MIREAIQSIEEKGYTVTNSIKDVIGDLELLSKKVSNNTKSRLKDFINDLTTLNLEESNDTHEGLFDFFKKPTTKKYKISKDSFTDEDAEYIIKKMDDIITAAEYEYDNGIFIDSLEEIRTKLQALYKYELSKS